MEHTQVPSSTTPSFQPEAQPLLAPIHETDKPSLTHKGDTAMRGVRSASAWTANKVAEVPLRAVLLAAGVAGAVLATWHTLFRRR